MVSLGSCPQPSSLPFLLHLLVISSTPIIATPPPKHACLYGQCHTSPLDLNLPNSFLNTPLDFPQETQTQHVPNGAQLPSHFAPPHLSHISISGTTRHNCQPRSQNIVLDTCFTLTPPLPPPPPVQPNQSPRHFFIRSHPPSLQPLSSSQ